MRATRTRRSGDRLLRFLSVNFSPADTISSKVGHGSYRVWHDTFPLQLPSQKELSIHIEPWNDKESKTQGEKLSSHNSWPCVFDSLSCKGPGTASRTGHYTVTCSETLRMHFAKFVIEWWCSRGRQNNTCKRRRTDTFGHDGVLAVWCT